MSDFRILIENAEVKMLKAVVFMNSNKMQRNIYRKIVKIRYKCFSHGIILEYDVIINKRENRDIDRDAFNMLISLFPYRMYQMIVKDKLLDPTTDIFVLKEFLNDIFVIGVSVVEFKNMQNRRQMFFKKGMECTHIGNIVRMCS